MSRLGKCWWQRPRSGRSGGSSDLVTHWGVPEARRTGRTPHWGPGAGILSLGSRNASLLGGPGELFRSSSADPVSGDARSEESARGRGEGPMLGDFFLGVL